MQTIELRPFAVTRAKIMRMLELLRILDFEQQVQGTSVRKDSSDD